jgi:Fe2+ or Zn2+ uptake regulation protein
VQDFERLLRGLKLKATPRRRAVLEVMAAESTFLSPEEIWRKAAGRVRNIGLPTVYRILDELAARGVATRILHEDRQLYYYLCANKSHHHHFVCLSCRKVEDVGLCLGEVLEQEVAQRIKGALVSHILQLQGFCRECKLFCEGDDPQAGARTAPTAEGATRAPVIARGRKE